MLAQTRIVILFAAVVLLPGSRRLEAQPDTSIVTTPVTPKRALCWRPRSEARCGSYLVTEFAIEKAVLSSSENFGNRFVGTIGPMINRGPREAWGLLASISTNDPDALDPLRVEGRYRKWLGSTSGLDLALGLTRNRGYYYSDGTYGTEREVQLRGLTAAVGIEQGFIGIDARVDFLRGGGESDRAVFMGVRAGSYAGPVTALALVAGFVGLMMVAYSGG